MFGITKQIRQAAAYRIIQMIVVNKARYAMTQNKLGRDDLVSFIRYQNKITALSDLQEEIELKFKLITNN